MTVSVREEGAHGLLLRLGADRLPHPGGTLLQHLGRVADLLTTWGAEDDLRMVGLCHAAYGTAVFPEVLIPVSRREDLRSVIGPIAESWVYRYGSCDRVTTYPRIGRPGPLVFTDRFTATTEDLDATEAAMFMEVTAANELDIAKVNPPWGELHRDELRALFTAGRHWLSSAAWTECETVLEV